MSKTWTRTIAIVVMLCMVLSTDLMAGPAKAKKKGFFAKIGHAIKQASQKAAKAVKTAAQKTGTAIKNAAQKTGAAIKNAAVKTGMAIKTAGAKVVNAGMDTGVWAKQKLLGKKNKVWVCGHYDKNGKWTKGHWRKLSAGKPAGNSADQSAGSYTPASEPAAEETPVSNEAPANEDEGLSGDGNSYEESTEMPVASEDPVLPELPAQDNNQQQAQESEQASQESEEATQSGEAEQGEFKMENEVTLRTMGMLMNDIVKQSKSINQFKRSANANVSFSVEVQEDINTTYEVREDDASLLARVVVWDLQQNGGEAGKYYNFFVSKMKALDPQSRSLVKDVVDEIRAGIVHGSNNAASDEEKAQFDSRLSELANY